MRNCRRGFLRPLAWLYGSGVDFRNQAYDQQLFQAASLDARVISIGNISVGGSGKSELLVQLLKQWQRTGVVPWKLWSSADTVGVLSRGYGRDSRGVVRVSNSRKILADARIGGDEPWMIARRVPGIPVVSSEQRLRGGKWLVDEDRVNTVLLDDGFQHRALSRDLDLVIYDPELREHGCEALLPEGWLREPLSSLARAQRLLLHHPGDEQKLKKVRKSLDVWFQGDYGLIIHDASRLVNPLTLEPVTEVPRFAFAGLAHPERFHQDLIRWYSFQGRFRGLRDHQKYSPALKADLRQWSDGEPLVTTWKDVGKFSDEEIAQLQLRVLEQSWRLEEWT